MRDASCVLDARTLPELLAARARSTPDAVAFTAQERPSGWRPVTWRAFHDSITRLAAALHGAGLQPGERVGILAPTSRSRAAVPPQAAQQVPNRSGV